MRYSILLLFVVFASVCMAEGSYYLPPSDDVVVENFDVYLSFDSIHNKNAKLSKRDSVFQYLERKAIVQCNDKVGRFAVWRMLPQLVIVPDSISGKTGTVNITVENAPISTLADTVRTSDGDVLLPYSIWARVQVLDANGKELLNSDYGLLKGSVSLSSYKKRDNIIQSTSIVGITEAVKTVRNEVFSRFGFDMCKDATICQVPESSKYYVFLKIVNGNLTQFVDFYTYNDLLSQMFKLNFPYKFIEQDTAVTKAKSVEGIIVHKGEIEGTYTVEYENGKFKQLGGYLYGRDNDGKVVKHKLNTIFGRYDKKTGEYLGISTSNGQFIRVVFPGYNSVMGWSAKNKLPTYCRTENMLGSLFSLKEQTVETADVSIDLNGKIYIEGNTSSSIPFGLFKVLADSNYVKIPMLTSENHTEFHCEEEFDKHLNVVSRKWSGKILLEKNRGENNYSFIKLDDCTNVINVIETDQYGNAQKYSRKSSGVLSINWGLGNKLKIPDAFEEGRSNMSVTKVEGKDVFDVDYDSNADVNIFYDENGDVVLYKVGSVEIIRKVNY